MGRPYPASGLELRTSKKTSVCCTSTARHSHVHVGTDANVVALETLNEPPMGGLWDAFVGRPSRLLRMRSELWRFQAAALAALA